MLLLTATKGNIAQQLSSKRPVFHFARSLFTLGSVYGAVGGVIYLSLADFYTIIFTSPLILTILGSFFLREKTDVKSWIAILFGFAGVIVAVRFANPDIDHLPWIGVGLTCLASITMAFSMLAARRVTDENFYALSFWPQFAGTVVSILVMIVFKDIVFDTVGIACASISGILGATGAMFVNASLRVAPVAVVSPYHYTQIIGGAIAGYLIWHNVPDWSVIIGAIMVTLSGLYILHVETRKKSKTPYLNVANFPT
jgi:drug/metabolite transporter (DMT)-like permease